jgi:hypothetical protein
MLARRVAQLESDVAGLKAAEAATAMELRKFKGWAAAGRAATEAAQSEAAVLRAKLADTERLLARANNRFLELYYRTKMQPAQ